ncbi:hypothetical protein HMPREF9124_2062 [Oribacterium sp. oral taxon 108 str. F0425]|nr:hypothetical protein HMPREF9124_2062 [Oribacterium sp. oral taxon 108 str. F0425]
MDKYFFFHLLPIPAALLFPCFNIAMHKTDIFFQKYSYLPIVYNFNFYKPFIHLKKAKLA